MAETLSILKPGSEITLIGDIHAVIVAVMIEGGGRVSYKVLWVNGTGVEEKWVDEFILKPACDGRIRVGFGGKS